MQSSETALIARIVDLLGGGMMFERPFSTALEALDNIERGFPGKALLVFIDRFPALGCAETIDSVVGVGLGTVQRHRQGNYAQRLTREQSHRLYRSAEIVAKAIEVFGSNEAVERFLDRPVMALNRKRPIDLISTTTGAELVERHLDRLNFGVYT